MEINEHEISEGTIVQISGHLDHFSSVEVQKKLLELLEKGKKAILLDLTSLSHISSAGLRTLLIAAKKAKEKSAFLCLFNVSAPVREILEMTGFVTYIKIYSDLDTALSVLRA